MGTTCFPSQGVGKLREPVMLKMATAHICDLSEGREKHSSFGGELITGRIAFNPYDPEKRIMRELQKFSIFVCCECRRTLGKEELFRRVLASGKISRVLMGSEDFLIDLFRKL